MESGVYTVFSLGCEDQVHMEIGGEKAENEDCRHMGKGLGR